MSEAVITSVPDEPKPLLFVYRYPGRLSVEARHNILAEWRAIQEAERLPPAPLVVLQGGADLKAVYPTDPEVERMRKELEAARDALPDGYRDKPTLAENIEDLAADWMAKLIG